MWMLNPVSEFSGFTNCSQLTQVAGVRAVKLLRSTICFSKKSVLYGVVLQAPHPPPPLSTELKILVIFFAELPSLRLLLHAGGQIE